MKNFIVTVEYRYGDYTQEKQTLGIFEDISDAINCGNDFCIVLENKYPLNPNYNIKRRFNKSTLTMGNLAYIKTPFAFYAKIEKLRYFETEQLLNNIEKSITEYEEYKKSEENY